MTSHDVINVLRRKYHQKKFGHTGTLDPDATGVLVVLCGKATKVNQFLADTDKTYQAEIQLGYSTTTDDISGEIVETKEINTNFDTNAVLQSFVGPLHQQVPMTSSKKINGKKLLDYQRKGEDIKPVFQDVQVYSMKQLGKLSFEVHCSSGTYVRSICRDFGEKTNNKACMKSLCRTQVGRFSIDQAYTLEQLDQEEPVLYSIKDVLDHFQMIEYEDIQSVYQGKRIRIDTDVDDVCITDKGQPIAIYQREHHNVFRSKRGLW